MAAKRGSVDFETEDLEICAATGWTPSELNAQTVYDVERMMLFLEIQAQARKREAENLKRQRDLNLSSLRI